MLKAVILIGGPQKGTRFRPLSFEVPKPLFPVAGVPMIQHHIEACTKVPNMKEILLIGFYQPNEALSRFLVSAQQEFKMPIRYLQEYAALGTGGGIYHFRDQILTGNPEAFFVLNADVCSEFPLGEMLSFHRQRGDHDSFLMLGTTANRKQSLNYGCIVANAETHEVLHYVEKPSTFVSELINCGIYLFTPAIFHHIGAVFQHNQQELLLGLCIGEESSNGWQRAEAIRLEQDVFTALAGQGRLFAYKTEGFWSQIKSAGSAIYANRLYLSCYSQCHPERLAQNHPGGPTIRGNVYIHPTASVDASAVLGPNVSIGKGVTIGAGVRVRESIILHGASLQTPSLEAVHLPELKQQHCVTREIRLPSASRVVCCLPAFKQRREDAAAGLPAPLLALLPTLLPVCYGAKQKS
ncbi:mannose-1-phosphate guanyltransferase alpha isoform X3 [Hemicordylus capensis]|uniref:mannose-1-phosphate guanyltransferase alpha isoform X3 n=1 Tax=Hemicordylus capensis TaxID=884348 RepID=UPI002302B2AC|nr:mannose-1-phosphate guanyltransferase alpha isoform X3 [Hemicordylus capensis]